MSQVVADDHVLIQIFFKQTAINLPAVWNRIRVFHTILSLSYFHKVEAF